MSRIDRHRSWATLAMLAMAGAAQAANECKVEYGYHTGSGFNREDETVTVNINAGQSKQVNRSNMNFVRNEKSHKVKVTLNNKSLTLNENNVDPPVSFYLSPTTLKTLECLTSVSEPVFGSPEAMAQGLKQAGKTAAFIAEQLKTTFNRTNSQIVALLKGVGYTVGQIAQALYDGADATADQAAAALKTAGYTATQIAAALVSGFDATAAQVAAALKAAGYTVNQIAQALFDGADATADQAAAALKAAGYTAAQIAAALVSGFNATAEQVARALKAAGYTANQIAQALFDGADATASQAAAALKAAGYTVGQVAAALIAGYGATAEQVAAALRAAGFTLNEVAGALRSAFQNILRNALEAALRAAGWTAREIAGVLDTLYGAAEQALAPEYSFAYHGGSNRGPVSCNYPSGSTPYAVEGGGSDPLPLPVGRTTGPYTVTFFGSRNMGVISSLSSLPSGIRPEIVSRGNCYVEVRFDARGASVREGASGTGRLNYGRAESIGFAWRTGPVPAPRTGTFTGGAVGRGPAAGSRTAPPAAEPDLLPSFTGTLLRHLGNNRRISESFCQNLPSSRSATADDAGIISVPNLNWGVINSANVATGNGFRIELRGNGQTLRPEQVGALPAGGSGNFTYARPQSQTRVIRVRGLNRASSAQYGPPGCYQEVMAANDPMNWQDPSYEVRVDTANGVSEGAGGETNNTAQY